MPIEHKAHERRAAFDSGGQGAFVTHPANLDADGGTQGGHGTQFGGDAGRGRGSARGDRRPITRKSAPALQASSGVRIRIWSLAGQAGRTTG